MATGENVIHLSDEEVDEVEVLVTTDDIVGVRTGKPKTGNMFIIDDELRDLLNRSEVPGSDNLSDTTVMKRERRSARTNPVPRKADRPRKLGLTQKETLALEEEARALEEERMLESEMKGIDKTTLTELGACLISLIRPFDPSASDMYGADINLQDFDLLQAYQKNPDDFDVEVPRGCCLMELRSKELRRILGREKTIGLFLTVQNEVLECFKKGGLVAVQKKCQKDDLCRDKSLALLKSRETSV